MWLHHLLDGGHSDGESDTLAVAQREAEEESGLDVVCVSRAVFDLDVHGIGSDPDDATPYVRAEVRNSRGDVARVQPRSRKRRAG